MGAGRFPKGRVEGVRILHAVAVMCDPSKSYVVCTDHAYFSENEHL
jgi:hypothetical protein